MPKPFLRLAGDRTLLQQTLDRFDVSENFNPTLIVASARHLTIVEEQVAECDVNLILSEPRQCNTAPAIALAASQIDRDSIMLVCPADHHICDLAAFRRAAIDASQLASENWLVSIGVEPDRPETGYGYIKLGEPLRQGFSVANFKEKPGSEQAQALLDAGGYLWNSGIFAFRAGTLLEELQAHRPSLARAIEEAVAGGRAEGARFDIDPAPLAKIKPESIDYAIMENTSRAAVIPARMGWTDIGSLDRLKTTIPADERGNRALGPVSLTGCSDVFAYSEGVPYSISNLENALVVVSGKKVWTVRADGSASLTALDI